MDSALRKSYRDLLRLFALIICCSFLLVSCCKEDTTVPSDTIAETTVDLDANSSVVRAKESIIGNLIADAILFHANDQGAEADFAVINGGGIRFDREILSSGIYPKGPITDGQAENMLPFENSAVLVTLTGTQMREIFERSVSEVESLRGQFLQVSKGMSVQYDLSKPAQIVNETVEPNVVSTPGQRVVSIKIGGVEVVDSLTYKGIFPDFITEGNDGYVTFTTVPESLKKPLDFLLVEALKEYLILHSPVTPVLEQRITYN